MRQFFWALLALVTSGLALATGCRPPANSTDANTGQQEPFVDIDELKDRIDAILDHTYYQRRLDVRQQNAWQIVHGLLVFGRDYQVKHDGQEVAALQYLLQGGTLNGWNLRPGDVGVVAVAEPGTKTGQGHPDQWLGYLSQCGVQPEEKLVVAGKEYTVGDLVRQAQWDLTDGMEATWTLMALSTYFDKDAEWKSRDGQTWNLERIVRMESERDLGESACGGTHRMYGLAVALNAHLAEGGRADEKLSNGKPSGWKLADDKIRYAIKRARLNQQPDGSFSTQYFQRPATTSDLGERLGSTGHTLEFLTVAMTDEELRQPWVARSVDSVVSLLEVGKDRDLECGQLYHAAHGLLLYRDRVFGPRPDAFKPSGPGVAKRPSESPAVENASAAQASDQPAGDAK